MLNPGDTIERYEVVRTIGIGGHATVYLLKHRTLGSEHALKVVNLHRPDLRARLLQEGRIQANLQHPNIVPVTDVLEVGGLQALLMPFVDGPDLQLWLEQNHPVPIAMAVQLFREIVDAVGFAHDQGLVHRDLKPANILMNRQSDRWRPHITDFGIAKITGNQGGAGTRSGIGMGTPAYMAPEQVQNAAHVDHRADIFALGCILYEFISGTRLFSAPNPLAIAADIAGPVPIDLSAIHEGVAPSVRAVLNGCLEKDRERRFPDCGVILRALEDVDVAAIISPSIRKTSAQASSRTVEAAPTPAVPLETPLAPLETPAQPLAPSGDQAPATGPALQATQSGPATPALDASHRSRRSTLPTPLPLQPPPKPSSAWLFGLAGMLATLAVGWFVLDAFTPPTSSSGVTTRPVPPPPATVPEPPAEETAPPLAPSTVLPSTEPQPAAPKEPSKSPAPPGPTERMATSKSPAATGTEGPLGLLHVDARPYANIWLDGKHQGETNQTFELKPGSYRLRLQARDELEHTQSVMVQANGNTSYCWDFELKDTC